MRASMNLPRGLLGWGLASFVAVVGSAAASAQAPRTVRTSSGPNGEEANTPSNDSKISASGRFVVYESHATNLVPGDSNGAPDVFLFDLMTKAAEIVSLGSSGVQGNDRSAEPSISPDGRFVAFTSLADNLVPGDSNGQADVFVRDRLTHTTVRVSLLSGGGQSSGGGGQPSISDDGQVIAFASQATDLVPGITNGKTDIFVHNRSTGQTVRVSVSSSGAEADGFSERPSISGDGRFVAFRSAATNLDPGHTGGNDDIFVHDVLTGQTEMVSVSSTGIQSDGPCNFPSISGDGRYVAFQSPSGLLVPNDVNFTQDAFVHDRWTGETTLASLNSLGQQANQGAWWPSISYDGQFVAFASTSTNLVLDKPNGGWDCYVHDRVSGETRIVSVDSGGNLGKGTSGRPTTSNQGRVVAFASDAQNLVPGTTSILDHNYTHSIEGCTFPEVYCVPSLTSLPGCDMDIEFTHAPLASSPQDFLVTVRGVGANVGICFVGVSGAQNVPFGTQGGAICVKPPLWRTAPKFDLGSPATCTGLYQFDLAELMATSPAIAVGTEAFVQIWARDRPSPDGFAISDAIRFTVCP